MKKIMEVAQEEQDAKVHEPIRAAIELFENELNESQEISLLKSDNFSILLDNERQRLALKTLLNQGLLGKSWHAFLSWNTFKILLLEMSCVRQAIGVHRSAETNFDDQIVLEDTEEELAEQKIKMVESIETALSDVRILKNIIILPLPSNYSRCLTSPVLLSSYRSLQRVAGVTAFQETVQLFIDGTWLLLAGSLVVNQIINVTLYPSYYPDKLRD